MGLMDGAIGSALGGVMNASDDKGAPDMLGGLMSQVGGKAAGGNKMLATMMTLVTSMGGVDKLLAKFTDNGMGNLVKSWVGGGDNLPVSGAQVQKALGDSAIKDVASKLGVDEAQASSSIATMLPDLVNNLTPNNAVDSGSNDMLSKGLSMLTSQLGK